MQQNRNSEQGSFPMKETLTFIGVIITAYIGYLGIRSQTEIPIRATQTKEAKQTMSPQMPSITSSNNSIESITTIEVSSISTPTFITVNTLVPTSTPNNFLHQNGSVSLGWFNQWDFSTNTTPIKINVKLDKPPSHCEITVHVWDRDAKQTIFEQSITSTETNFLAYVTTVAPYGNYTALVGVPDPNTYSICDESKIYSFEITISP